MTALAANREDNVETNAHLGADGSIPAAAGADVFQGAIVCVDTTTLPGFGKEGQASTTLVALGIAKDRVDNSAGADGDLRIEYRSGTFRFKNSAAGDEISFDDIGKTVYLADDQTASLTDQTASLSALGVVVGVQGTQASPTDVDVLVGPGVQPA